MEINDIIYKLTAEVAALTATVRENNLFLRDFIEAQRHCNRLVEEKIRDIELHGSRPASDALEKIDNLNTRIDLIYKEVNQKIQVLEACSSAVKIEKGIWDHAYARAALIIGIGLGIIGFLFDVYYIFLSLTGRV